MGKTKTAVIQIEELDIDPAGFVKRNRVKDKIGDILGYGRCDCGKSWLYGDHNNPGRYLGNGKRRMICNECYLSDREAIDASNKEKMSQEIWVYDTSGE